MIGIVVATHGNLGAELLESVQMIIGPVRNACAVSVTPEKSMEDVRSAILAALQTVSVDGQGALIATDMFGGTPANVGMSLMQGENVEVMTGVNLPMLLKFFNSQENLSLSELATMLKSYGQQSIALASDYMKQS